MTEVHPHTTSPPARPASISPAAVAPIVAARFFSSTAYYSVVPIIAIWLVLAKHVPTATAASAAGVLVLVTRAGYLAAVPVERALGVRKALLVSGALAVGACVVGQLMPSAPPNPVLFTFVVALGLASSSITLILRVVVARVFPKNLVGGFSYLNLAVNIGAAVGPIIGTVFISHSPQHLLLGVTTFQMVAVIAAFLITDDRVVEPHAGVQAASDAPGSRTSSSTPEQHEPDTDTDTDTDREVTPPPGSNIAALIVFGALSSLTFAAYGALFTALPNVLAATDDSWVVGAAFAVNAGLVILLQLPVGRSIGRRTVDDAAGMARWAALGNVAVAVSCSVLVLVSVVQGKKWFVVGFLVAIAVFTLGEVIFTPVYDSLVASLSATRHQSTSFAVVGVAWGSLEAAATSAGILVMSQHSGAATTAVWTAAAAVTIIAALGFILAAPRFPGAIPTPGGAHAIG